MIMNGKIKDIFTDDEWLILSEFTKEVSKKMQDLPIELNADKELMGDFTNE